MTKQYKTFLRMYFTMRVCLRFFEHVLPEAESNAYMKKLAAWEQKMRSDFKNELDPQSEEVDNAKFVTKDDSAEWFEFSESTLNRVIELTRTLDKFHDSEESQKHFEQMNERLNAADRHCSVVMARFLTWAIACLGRVEGTTRIEQFIKLIDVYKINTDRDPELLADLHTDNDKRLKNWRKFSRGRDESTRVNCRPGSGSNHERTNPNKKR